MAQDKLTLHQEAIDLLARINEDLKDSKRLATINVKMVGVVKDLNDIMVSGITGYELES